MNSLMQKWEIGMMMHTALRKCCGDEDKIRLAYNIIEVIDPEVWNTFIELVWKEMEDMEFTTGACIQAATEKLGYESADTNALRLILRTFDSEDFQNMGYYITRDRTQYDA